MAVPSVIFIWEKTLYYQIPDKGWASAHLERMENALAVIQEHYKKGTAFIVGYDPDIMQTEYTECPTGGRPIVKEALSSTHETVANMHTAWGFQTPWQLAGGGSGNAGTFFSYETAPALYLLIKEFSEYGYTVQRAFPMATLGMLSGGTPGRTNIFLVIDSKGQAFVSLYTSTGLRACRKLYGGKRKDNYDIWSEISLVFGEYGITFDDGSQRPQLAIYQATGTDITKDCPYWDVLHTQAQTTVADFTQLAGILKSVPSRHTSSLMDDLPKTVRLDIPFQVISALFLLVLLGVGIYAYISLSTDSREIGDLEQTQSDLNEQRAHFEKNKREMEKLLSLYSQDAFEYSKGRLKMLLQLPTAIPKAATLTYVSAGGGSTPAEFRMGGVFWPTNERQGAAASAQPQRGATAANTNTPITPIVHRLESSIQGLLVNAKDTNYTQGTGDFTIVGTTPLPESTPNKTTANTNPPAGQKR